MLVNVITAYSIKDQMFQFMWSRAKLENKLVNKPAQALLLIVDVILLCLRCVLYNFRILAFESVYNKGEIPNNNINFIIVFQGCYRNKRCFSETYGRVMIMTKFLIKYDHLSSSSASTWNRFFCPGVGWG